MIDVLGLKLDEAVKRLQSVGVSVLVEEYSSKKGVPGADEKRVIRQVERNGGTELVCSAFLSRPVEETYENG